MERIWLDFDPSDEDIAELIASSTPPKGVTVGRPACVIKASSNSGGVFIELAISFAAGIPSSILASWIYDQVKNRPKKSGRVNHDQIDFSQQSIKRLIDKELANQKARDAQWAKEHKQPRKKRS